MFIVFDKCDYINDLVHVTVTWVKVFSCHVPLCVFL